MNLSTTAFSILVSTALIITVASPLVLIGLFIFDWRRKKLW